MKKLLSEISVLVVHIREREKARHEEAVSFALAAGIDVSQVQSLNVLRENIDHDRLSSFDAIIIGGAGAFSATSDHPFYPRLESILNYAMDHELPVFGSCWGHQYIARFFGAQVVSMPEVSEYGCVTVSLTESGKDDPVLSVLSETFTTLAGHEDQVRKPVSDMIILAENELCPVQAFKIKDLPIYGTQFHPELTQPVLRSRMLLYKHHLPFPDIETFNEVYQNVPSEHDSQVLLHQFIRKFVGEPDYIA